MKIRYLFIILLLSVSSCRYKDQVVEIYPTAPKLRFSQKYDRKIDFKVVDSRKNKELIGFKNPVSVWKFKEEARDSEKFLESEEGYNFKVNEITNTQDIAEIVSQKFTNNLNNKGLIIERFSSSQLKVEIEELGFVAAMYRNFIFTKFKVGVRTTSGKFEKNYNTMITSYRPMPNVLIFGPFDPGLSNGYYNDVINQVLDENIAQVLRDSEIWNLIN